MNADERSLAEEITEGFKALETMRNNEPVAWMGKDYDGIKTDLYFDVERNKLPYRLYESAIPLYTHPVKELTLTDDEVEEFEWVLKKHFNFPTSEKVPNLDRIIRAILRKAQEK